MATTLKRILAVVALIAVVFTVGFLVFTGNRLSRYPNATESQSMRTVSAAKRLLPNLKVPSQSIVS